MTLGLRLPLGDLSDGAGSTGAVRQTADADAVEPGTGMSGRIGLAQLGAESPSGGSKDVLALGAVGEGSC